MYMKCFNNCFRLEKEVTSLQQAVETCEKHVETVTSEKKLVELELAELQKNTNREMQEWKVMFKMNYYYKSLRLLIK